jgi:putative membrane protein
MKQSNIIPLRCAAVLLAATCLSSLSAAPAQSNSSSSSSSSPAVSSRADNTTKLSHGDRAFLEKAAKAGMKEVDVSKSVESRLVDPQAKAFAQMMVSDHTQANTELMALASRKGVTLPDPDMKLGEKWSKKTKDVDDDYIKEMKEDHEEVVKLFEKGTKADDPEIAAFASKTLPALQHHLSMVSEIKKMK